MAKVSYRALSERQRQEMLRLLAKSLLTANNEKEMSQLLQQLLTPSEIVMVARRIQVAGELLHGASYREIRQKIGVGISTIYTIDLWLKDILSKYQVSRRNVAPRRKQKVILRADDIVGSFDDVRHRYGSKFLLINLLLDGLQ